VSKNLLVIEDSPTIAKVIERIGMSLKYTVTIASSFAEVKTILAQTNDFFVATIDYGLPDALNGEVIPYVIEHGIPSVVMTGRMDDETHQKIINLPVVDYITKENSQAYHYLLRILHKQQTNHMIGVLVVDDSLTARNHIAQLLERRNFKVFKASDGTKALQILEQNSDIKVILVDQEMPGMNGIELVQKIRKMYSKNKHIIIGLSGANLNFQSARFIKNGADDFLRKPFCPEEFYCRIMQSIEKIEYIEEIAMAANQDYLTSLQNRRHFLEQAVIRQQQLKNQTTNCVLAILYIDDFKNINQKHGSHIGDKILVTFANLLKQFFDGKLIARFGGAEFALIVSHEDMQKIEEMLDNLRKAAEAHSVKDNEQSYNFTISIGSNLLMVDEPIKSILKQADAELHKAVEEGGNRLKIGGFIDLC
jgi:diguanylate cyclase (GGDEF)-like protein